MGFGRFRPQSVGEIFDAAFSLYRRNFVLFVLIAAFVQIPSLVLSLISNAALQTTRQNALSSQGFGATTASVGSDQAIAGLVTAGLAAVALLLLGPIGIAATSRAVSDRYLDRPTAVATVFGVALRRIWALLGMSMLVLAMVCVPGIAAIFAAFVVSPFLLLLVIPALACYLVVLLVFFVMAPQAIILEGCGPVASLRRSRHLSRGFFWRIIGIGLLLYLMQLILGVVLGSITLIFLVGSDPATAQTISTVGGAIINIFTSPIVYATLTLLYYDIRIRREAFDVEMLAQSL